MMGFPLQGDQLPVIKATNCLLVASEEDIRPRSPALPCIRCGDCATVCPAQLLPQQLYWHTRGEDYEQVENLNLYDCIECGCCDLACPSHIPLTQYFRYAKAEIWSQRRERQRSDAARHRFEARNARIESERSERARRLAEKTKMLQTGAADPATKQALIDEVMKRVVEKKASPSKETGDQ